LGAHSQPAWRIDNLSVAEGLSQGYIYAIHQDRKGFIWIGTHGGLNRYDGYRFRVFQYKPFDNTTLGDNAVFFIREDTTAGKFWMGGSSSLNEFDPKTFTNVRHRYTKQQLEFADGIFVNDHELLLACEYAVLLFDTRQKVFVEVPVFDNGTRVSVSRVENVASDKSGNFMIMSRSGVFFYNPETRRCERQTQGSPDFSAFKGYEIFNVLHDSRGFYWIATNKMGLIRFDPGSGEVKTLPLTPPLRNESIRFDLVVEDSRGTLWAGSSNGLFQIDPLSMKFQRFSSEETSPVVLSHNEINAITEDRNHFVWIGTVGAGIDKLIPRGAGFRNVSLIGSGNEAQPGTYIMTLNQMGDEIWFANIWDQLGKLNMRTGSVEILDRTKLPGSYTWYSEGVLVATDTNELSMLNGEYVYRIQKDRQGHVWFTSEHGPGLSFIHRSVRGKVWTMVKVPVDRLFQRNDTIYGNPFFYDAVDDVNGNLWIGSSRGLIKFDTERNTFTQYQHDDNNTNSISSDYIYSLEIDDNEEYLWMAAYNGGLCSYHIPSETFRHYSREDGLSDNIVYSIEKDDHGNFWFSSNEGISAYDVATGTFRNYSVTDGLLNSEYNRRSSFRNKQGWIFFGGVSGIDYFHPDSIVRDNIRSNLTFTGFRVSNKDYIPDETNGSPVIELRPDDRQVTVEFASLDYSDQRKIQYAYRVNNREWITTGNQSALSFSDLAKGRHRVYIRSTSSDGIWQSREIDCLIIVKPWWWEKWWFRSGTGLLALVLMVSVLRYYYHRKLERQKIILERQQAVEKERTRIATDMHDDLGASLSRIKFLSETIAIKKQKQETIEEEVSGIRTYAHDMIERMGEIVWALNEKNDSLSDLISYARSYAAEYLSQNDIDTYVEMTEGVSNLFVSGEFRRSVYLTIKEALHNIVKHAQATTVVIRFETGKDLCITIQDNGTGFDEMKIRPYCNGIASMRGRIAALGGHFEIRNAAGSTIIVRVPLPLT
jgi:signal transduction histidine kinase/ligand-binding sensor domain-containing protein